MIVLFVCPMYDCAWMIHHYLMTTEKANERWQGRGIRPTDEVEYAYEDKKKKMNMLKPKDRHMTRIFEIWDKDNKKVIFVFQKILRKSFFFHFCVF